MPRHYCNTSKHHFSNSVTAETAVRTRDLRVGREYNIVYTQLQKTPTVDYGAFNRWRAAVSPRGVSRSSDEGCYFDSSSYR